MLGLLAALVALQNAGASEGPAGIDVDAKFPGGNIVVDKIEGDKVFLRQDLRDTAGDWFYWCFRVRGAAGRTLAFTFTKGNVIGVRGPATSGDGGKTWAWLGTAAVRGASFHYDFPAEAREVRFAFAIPYLDSDLKQFLDRHARNPAIRVETLCRTAKGREVELLRVGRLDGAPEHRVLLTARHHACESLADYALEGLLETVLADRTDGAWLRNHVEFMAVPFMDKDGVEDGDQGKNRKPHDHNRDYVQRIYPSVKALTGRVPAWSEGKLRVALDLHCPWIRGQHNEVIYFVGGPEQENWQRTGELAKILEDTRQGPLVYRTADNLPFGKAWNTATGDPKLQSFGRWAAGLPGIRIAGSIEIPYANAAGKEVTAGSARAFGARPRPGPAQVSRWQWAIDRGALTRLSHQRGADCQSALKRGRWATCPALHVLPVLQPLVVVRQVGPGAVHGPVQLGLLLRVQLAALLDGQGHVVDLLAR